MSDDGSFDFSTALFHVTMSHGKSALIRYSLPHLKLSSSTLALARDRTPSTIKYNEYNKSKIRYPPECLPRRDNPAALLSSSASQCRTPAQ